MARTPLEFAPVDTGQSAVDVCGKLSDRRASPCASNKSDRQAPACADQATDWCCHACGTATRRCRRAQTDAISIPPLGAAVDRQSVVVGKACFSPFFSLLCLFL